MRDSEMEIVQRYVSRAPVDVQKLIGELGIQYIEEPLPEGVSGKIHYDEHGGYYVIRVNTNQSRQRRNFTAAHEVAHYLLHRDLLHKRGHLDRLFDTPPLDNPSQPLRPHHEVEANNLAAKILMPEGAIKDEILWKNYDLVRVAEAFGVSAAAMAIRLKVLGIDLDKERVRDIREREERERLGISL
ncbi:ImmA/IrrE family metallo-endopeptidase [Sinorhizobium medicae]